MKISTKMVIDAPDDCISYFDVKQPDKISLDVIKKTNTTKRIILDTMVQEGDIARVVTRESLLEDIQTMMNNIKNKIDETKDDFTLLKYLRELLNKYCEIHYTINIDLDKLDYIFTH